MILKFWFYSLVLCFILLYGQGSIDMHFVFPGDIYCHVHRFICTRLYIYLCTHGCIHTSMALDVLKVIQSEIKFCNREHHVLYLWWSLFSLMWYYYYFWIFYCWNIYIYTIYTYILYICMYYIYTYCWKISMFLLHIQAYLEDIVHLFLDHHNKGSQMHFLVSQYK